MPTISSHNEPIGRPSAVPVSAVMGRRWVTPYRTALCSADITFAGPSHLDARPAISTTWLRSSLRRPAHRSRQTTMTCTSPV